MKTQIRRIIETEMAFGPMNTFADRLEAAILARIDAYCGSYRDSYHLMGEPNMCKVIESIQRGIIGGGGQAEEK